ncbi:hypothetical protein ADIARSV_2664 [Arcticibacter svalbardensis MN12-7]|uniref:Uncharacterized protein n=1 Tax=Arcticibacter svalbardensis MN12-7 TaxID=1150600 RepID=R9GYZ6_9SPHI|nr:hypothetical protein ADIARSV_2664 [Arcticibacter svalbardensis MN12-7]
MVSRFQEVGFPIVFGYNFLINSDSYTATLSLHNNANYLL